MSKVVKSVGRAISKVVKGAVKIVTSGIKATIGVVKSIAKSKLGKILLVAAAVYFGGAALMGGFGSSAAGGSFLSGMGTGVANAATSLSGAWSSALAGNFGAAGSSLSAGFQGTTTALQAGTQAAMATAVPTVSQLGSSFATDMTAAGVKSAALPGAAGATGTGLISGLSPMGQYAAISGGTQLVGGAIQGAGAQKAQNEQRAYEEQQAAAREAQYRASVDEFALSAGAGAGSAGAPGVYTPAATYDPVAEAKAIGDRYRADFDARNPTTGLVARGMQTPQPPTNNNFPVYNPYYYRG